jgi:methylmalonyl-CoA/ethylmalonyl-CoA epimerase
MDDAVATGVLLGTGYAFHHLGYATQCVAKEQGFFESIGYRQVGGAFSDEAQGVRGLFLEGAGPRLELLENLPASDTLTPWLGSSARIYHLGYFVADLEATLQRVRQSRGRIVVPPTPAVAFDGRSISFVMFRAGPMLELIQRDAV